MRLKGHKLTIEWSGEYGVESSSTGTCICGWQESGSNQRVVRDEYRWHLQREKELLERRKVQGLTEPQADLLERVKSDGIVEIRGRTLKIAEALQTRGLVEIHIGGSGVAFKAPWWYEVSLKG